jgi:two-component system sensor kinase FixL
MGEVAASVAHELNQPLTAVLSNAQALKRMVGANGRDGDAMREALDDIIEQDKRAGEVIRRMHKMLKKERFEWAPLDVNLVAEDVTRLMTHEAGLRGVSLDLNLLPGAPPVRGDRVQLQQVLMNLVLNAIQATSRAGGRGRVVVSTDMEDMALRVSVRDSGPGIGDEAEGRVFEPFFTTKTDGLGMGLSISRSIVELHGGHITACNQPAGGAEFSLTLPVEGVTA